MWVDFFKKMQTQKRKLENLELVRNVAWMEVGASMPACNMAVANPCTEASEMPFRRKCFLRALPHPFPVQEKTISVLKLKSCGWNKRKKKRKWD